MIKAELRSLLSRKLRTVLTMLAIVLGVSMIAGTYMLTDTINSAFDQIFKQANTHIAAVVDGKAVVSSEFGNVPPIPASLLSVVQHTHGVSAADGEIADSNSIAIFGSGVTKKNGKLSRVNLGATGGSPNILFGVGDQRFNSLTKVSGSWPSGYQVALDDSTMSRHNLHLGETVYIVTSAHAIHAFTIVGTTRYGTASTLLGATLIDMDLRTAQAMTGLHNQYDRISAATSPGVTDARLARNIRASIPTALRNRVQVRTRAQQAANSESQISQALNVLTIALLAFAGVAIFVGAFIIFNTFSITVAQRAREFALLRTLGGSRGQILRSVVLESLIVGLLASLVGLLAGYGIAKGLSLLFKLIGADLPATSLIVQSRTVIVALVVGTIVTTVSALVPALRATRVPPVAAMREGAILPKGRLSKFMPAISVAVIALGAALTIGGVLGSFSSTGTRLLVIGLGCVVLFLGVAMFTPQLIRPLASFVGWPIERFTAISGRLARDNTMRNPSRTATTAASLMIGLALVGFVTIFANELNKTATDAINREVAGSFIVENNSQGQNTIRPELLPTLRHLRGVTVATGLSADVARVQGVGKTRVDGVDPKQFASVYNFQWKNGSSQTLSSMGSHDALVVDSFASSNHLHVGSMIHVLTPAGIRDTFTVSGIFKSSQLLDPIVIPNNTFAVDWRQPDLLVAVVNKSPAFKDQAVENSISNVLAVSYPFLTVSSQAQYKSEQTMPLMALLTLIDALLGLSIVVSLFGIINTLILSIYERTREIGMLRAIGATRTQIRWTIRWESVITSLIGAILGLVLGVALAILITLGLQSQGIEFALPIGQLILFLVFAIIFGIVAAAFPARRAARLDVLQAISYE